MNDKENFVILLEIFNKLIKFQIFSFLRQPLTRLILDTREFIISYDKDNERDFIRALNTQEIVYSIIWNQQMKFMRKLLRSYFPFKDMMKQIEMSMERLNELEQQNKDLDSEDFDELREDQYIDIVNIYIQVYLSSKFSESNKEEIAKEFADHIFVQYFQMLSDFKEKTDFNDRSTYNLSTLRFLMIYMNVFIANFKKYMNFANDTTFQGNLARSHTERDFPTQFIKMKAYSGAQKKMTPCAKKMSPVQKKVNPCAKKMSLGEKNLFSKKLIFFVDKLNIIDFNIFNILKLIFTCESVAYLLQNNFVIVRFQLNSIYFACILLWWLVSSLSALFCVVSSRHSFLFSSLK